MITFHVFKNIPFQYFEEAKLIQWLNACAQDLNSTIAQLNYQFCNEQTMLDYNRQYLNHDFHTDILTFPLSHKTNPIAGDILINIDRMQENASQFNQPVDRELLRLMAHGLLHLHGYDDQDQSDKIKMTDAEDQCIDLILNSK